MILRTRRLRAAAISGFAVASTAAVVGIGNTTMAHNAEQRVAKAAACRFQPSGPVTASLDDTFAGLRALGGDLGTVTLDAQNVQRQGVTVHVEAQIHDVTSEGHTTGGTATVTVPYDQVATRLSQTAAPQTLTPGTDGHDLILTGTAATLPVPITVHTTLSVTPTTLTVTPTAVTVLGRTLPATDLGDRVQPRTVRLTALPTGVTLTSARADAAGLELGVAVAPTAGRSGC